MATIIYGPLQQRSSLHLSCPEEGLDVVWLESQDVPAGAQRLLALLQFELSGGQVVQTLHPVVLHLLLLCLHAAAAAICVETEPHILGYLLCCSESRQWSNKY